VQHACEECVVHDRLHGRVAEVTGVEIADVVAFEVDGELLSPEVRVVAVDLRGHGYSDKPPSGYGVENHVNDLLELIAALGLERPIMLGHSLGGSIATFVAEAAGDAIGGLVLLDAVVGDQAFIDSASLVLHPFAATLDQRFAGFEEYQSFWAAEDGGSQWARWLDRSGRLELAPLPDGTFRRRALRQALADEWASVAERDALAALSRVSRKEADMSACSRAGAPRGQYVNRLRRSASSS
jgi:pimeloyl-ACP methyl ester carboxylesterase